MDANQILQSAPQWHYERWDGELLSGSCRTKYTFGTLPDRSVTRLPATMELGANSSPRQPDPFNMSLSWTSYALNEKEVASDARVSERILMRCGARLSVETEAGSERTIKGRVLNMSSSGALVEALKPIAVGSQVRIQANELLVGTAFVRHSTRRSWRFRIGLEFATPVRDRY